MGVGTVSRVLNDSPRVSAATHARVRAAIDTLGYRRNRRARGLSLGRSHAIGVVAPFFTTPSVAERLRGISAALAECGYDLMIFDVETAAQRAGAFRDFARRDRIDGLLVISLQLTDEEVAALQRHGPPVVMVDVAHVAFPHVVIDDVLGGELATEHLLAKGHRSIGFVGDDAALSPMRFTSSERRREGYVRALERAGIKPSRPNVRRGGHGREPARALAEALLWRQSRPTAVFAASDVQAIGVLEGAAARGLRVPEDVAVIGFDDIEMAALVGLTTVRQPLRETGALGARVLLAELEGRPPLSPAVLVPLTVVERRTT